MRLSQKAWDKIKLWRNYRENRDRITWDEIWVAKAFLNAKRSHDPQTQCGAVIVSKDNVLISEGYNGFIRGINDEVLPNTRRDNMKYPFMIHAEENAILNAARNGHSTENTKCYVTGNPCLGCFQKLWQAGINEIITTEHQINMLHEDDEYIITREILESLIRENNQFVIRHI